MRKLNLLSTKAFAGFALITVCVTAFAQYLKLDGTTAMTGPLVVNSTAAISGGAFSVGGSTFVITEGNVGIGTAAPAYKLDVNGALHSAGAITADNGFYGDGSHLTGITAGGGDTYLASTQTFTGVNTFSNPIVGSITGNAATATKVLHGGVDLSTVTTHFAQVAADTTALSAIISEKLSINGANAMTGPLTVSSTATIVGNAFSVGGSTLVVTAGRIGIGTANPNNLIQVANLINFPISVGGTFIGLSAGTANTGTYNTAVGYLALHANTSGGSNTAAGSGALTNSTGSGNTALGQNVLYSNTTGGYNIALGMNAGRFIADGATANTVANNSVYLGYGTRASADNGSNEIVIGASATGAGTNSVVLGNDGITKTVLKGNIGIGTAAPAAKLEVNGTVKINGMLHYGAQTHVQLRTLACPSLPCMALSSDSPYHIYFATATTSGSWKAEDGSAP